jgi:MerR family transcriptional regulator, thiopeptide resistance regulator
MKASIETSKKAFAKMTQSEKDAMIAGLQPIEEALAEGFRRGIDPKSDVLDAVVARHKAWIAQMWGKPCTPEAYSGLADLHLSHPDFVKRYETIEAGFSDYHAAAMKAHAARLQSKA